MGKSHWLVRFFYALYSVFGPFRMVAHSLHEKSVKDSVLCKRDKKEPETFRFPAFFWSRWQDLNLRPFGPEPNALPNCATPRKWSQWRDSNPWPAVYETAALPTEPHWHLSFATSRIRLTRQNYTRISFACQPFFHTFFASFWKLCRSASKPGIPCFPPRTNMVY